MIPRKYRRAIKKSHPLVKWCIASWVIIIVVIFAEYTLHYFGWIIASILISAISYRNGRRSVHKRALAHIRANERYGQSSGPVTETDAVSAYPTEVIQSLRTRLLSDRLSGARSLFSDTEN